MALGGKLRCPLHITVDADVLEFELCGVGLDVNHIFGRVGGIGWAFRFGALNCVQTRQRWVIDCIPVYCDAGTCR